MRKFIFILALWSGFESKGAETNAFLEAWLEAQSKIKTWRADFTQTRTIKTLKQPLQARGHLIFAAPNRFRWTLGDPAQTIAIRGADSMMVIYPNLKRAERYPLAEQGNEPWRDALALMDAGFPENRADLERRFQIDSISPAGALAKIVLKPRSVTARRFMTEAQLFLRTNDFTMAANQLHFADGTVLRNDFTNAVVNPDLATNAFAAELPEGYEIVEPMKK